MMVPVGRLVLLRSVPRNEIVQALATLTIPALIGPIVGPPLGGFITTYFHWRWIFWINVPVGLLGIALATIYMPDIREEGVAPLDGLGFVLSGLGLSSLVFGATVVGRDILPFYGPPCRRIGQASQGCFFIAGLHVLTDLTQSHYALVDRDYRVYPGDSDLGRRKSNRRRTGIADDARHFY